MNIVQICPTPFSSLGGPAKNYAQFHAALNTTTVCFTRPSDGIGEMMVVPTKINIRTVGFPLLARYYYAGAAELKMANHAVSRADCLIIHNFYRFPALWAARTAQSCGVPYVLVLHGILDPWVFNKNGSIKRMWLSLYGYDILQHASVVLCATERERSKVQEHLRPDVGRVVPWAVEVPELHTYQSRREQMRASLRLRPEDRALIFLGRLDAMKRPEETVRLAAEIGDPRLKLIVVGPDANVTGRGLERLARRLKWDGLRVVGPCFGPEKNDYLGAADGYISLSHRENFNFTSAEAMGCGLPVILSSGNDLGWEFVGQGFSWQLRSQDMAEARAAVTAFLKAPAPVLADMGRAARAWVLANLNRELFKERLAAIVQDVAKKQTLHGD